MQSLVGRWFAARVGRVRHITFGRFAAVTARHDMQPSAVSALVALLHGSLEGITVSGERASHGTVHVSGLARRVVAFPTPVTQRVRRLACNGEGLAPAAAAWAT